MGTFHGITRWGPMVTIDPTVVEPRIIRFVFILVQVLFSFFGWLLAVAAIRYFFRVLRGKR